MEKAGSLKSVVLDRIMTGIVRGEYKPGEILTEGRLVEKYGCSRAPVREALAALCGSGLLRNLPRCGYQVVSITLEEIAQMLQFRLLLEGGLLPEVCRNLDAQNLESLRELAGKCERTTDSMWDHWEYNAQFHLQLLSLSRNEYAAAMLRRTMSILKCAYGQHYWDKWEHVCPGDMRYHTRILDALERGDCAGAAACLEKDLQDFAAFS